MDFEGLKLAPQMLIKQSALFGCNFMATLSFFFEPFWFISWNCGCDIEER